MEQAEVCKTGVPTAGFSPGRLNVFQCLLCGATWVRDPVVMGESDFPGQPQVSGSTPPHPDLGSRGKPCFKKQVWAGIV